MMEKKYIIVNNGMVYDRTSRRLCRRDGLNPADVGIASEQWLKDNTSIPGWDEAMASTLSGSSVEESQEEPDIPGWDDTQDDQNEDD